MMQEFRSFYSTPRGVGVVHASHIGVFRVDFPGLSGDYNMSSVPVPDFVSSAVTEYAAGLLQHYFAGSQVDFEDIPVDLSSITPFRRTILNFIRSVPYGDVRSYQQIAVACGAPRAARAVGGAMASNPVPIIIPCHRIVGSNGSLTGFSAPGGETAKIMLLRMEGVEFKDLPAYRKPRVMNSFYCHE